MANLTLTSGENCIVDEADLEFLIQHRWRKTPSGYAIRVESKRVIYMHRLILKVDHAEKIDHINGNTLDNRSCNLRPCTHAENCKNRKLQKNSKTGLKGVKASGNRWRASIYPNRNGFNLGTFASANEAAAAYDSAAIRIYGEFARTNRSMGLIP